MCLCLIHQSYLSTSSIELLLWLSPGATEENMNSIPEEIINILLKWKEYGQRHQQEYYSDPFICPVKFASEIFRYKGIDYVVYPDFMGLMKEYFEYLMIQKVEDELVDIGAEEVFCTAMMD